MPLISKKYDIVFLFDAKYSNPNGDPDADNLPRTNPYTGKGIVTDGCIKRKIRNFVTEEHSNTVPNKIYFRAACVLAEAHEACWRAMKKDATSQEREQWMIENYWDIRAFGAVLGVGKTTIKGLAPENKVPVGGGVTGPVSVGMSESIDKVHVLELGITRCSRTNADDKTVTTDGEDGVSVYGQMGRKAVIDYGLYVTPITISPCLAKRTGFSDDDLSILVKALQNLFELDRAAARPEMNVRGLYVFEHTSKYGNASSESIRNLVKITRKSDKPAGFLDYEIVLDSAPDGVTLKK